MAKIVRKFSKVFGLGGTVTNFGVFGSKRAGSPATSQDPAVIQGGGAFDTGFTDAINASSKAPYVEDVNGLHLTHSYQNAYILQEGIPEWNTDTVYYIGSIVKKTGTVELYSSLIDSNTGNALPSKTTDTNWKYLGTLATRNIVSYRATDSVTTTSATYTARTGASVTCVLSAGTCIRIDLSASFSSYTSPATPLSAGFFRLNIDSGTTYIALGGISHTMIYTIGAHLYISGLAAGSHTVSLEYKASTSSYEVRSLCGGTDPANHLSLTVEEII